MLCILGQSGAVLAGEFAPLPLQPKALALLAYLALAGRAVERQGLAQLLFPEAEEPRAALRWHLAYLRATLPSALIEGLRATRDSIALALPTDAARFREGAERICAQPDSHDAQAVLALYRGDLLAGLSVSATADFDTWLYVEQEGLRRLLRRATLAFAGWALMHGGASTAVAPLARLVSVEPYFEEGHVLLLDAYAALREHDHAAVPYERYQRIMRGSCMPSRATRSPGASRRRPCPAARSHART